MPSFFQKVFASLILLLSYCSCIIAHAQCDQSTLIDRQIRASDTDPNIVFELATHWAWINPACVPRDVLLVHMVGTIDNPLNATFFPALAANNGYHVVSLKYPNDASAQSFCRTSTDSACYELFHREVITGADLHPDVDVDATNCITNRLVKLLHYLHSENPTEGWDAYFSGNSILWSETALSGHSQGGGHAAFIAKEHAVQRVINFASPNDYSDAFSGGVFWTALPSATPDSAFFAFGNLHDDIANFGEELVQWGNMGLDQFGDTVLVTSTACPYENSHLLYTTLDQPGLAVNHSLMVRDDDTPIGTGGVPEYEPVWRYLLGLPCVINSVADVWNEGAITAFPNPFSGDLQFTLNNITGPTHIAVYNTDGRLVTEHRSITGQERVTLDLSELTSGVYHVRLVSADGERSVRVVKQ